MVSRSVNVVQDNMVAACKCATHIQVLSAVTAVVSGMGRKTYPHSSAQHVYITSCEQDVGAGQRCLQAACLALWHHCHRLPCCIPCPSCPSLTLRQAAWAPCGFQVWRLLQLQGHCAPPAKRGCHLQGLRASAGHLHPTAGGAWIHGGRSCLGKVTVKRALTVC